YSSFARWNLQSNRDNIVRSSIIKMIILISVASVVAISLGLILSKINNMEEIETLLETKKPSLPSVLLDKNGEIITEFYSDEKRDMVTLDMVPDFAVKALILWEDSSFYKHYGFNLFAIFRAAVNNLLGKAVSGASTLTQQLARTLFLTNEFSLNRKIKELWISIQLEKKYTKNEILTLYLNHVPFGYGTNGIQAASKLFFNKDVTDLTYSEAASLITVISNPTYYSFIKFPKNHKVKQKEVLRKMAKAGIISKIDADNSFNEFWLRWQSSAESSRGAFYNREDKAPYFSDWVLNEIEKKLPNVNVFRDGLVIHSTLDLKAQLFASSLMTAVLDKQQKIFEEYQLRNYSIVQNSYIDTLALLGDAFSLTNINVDGNRNMNRAITEYQKNINPSLNLTAQILGLNLIDTATEAMFDKLDKGSNLLSQVQGAFIALDNKTGQIVAMVGGKKFDPNNRFNYAMQSRRQPGSSFKPLIYSYALDSGLYNASSIFIDKPYVFTFDSEDPDDWYKPYNYGGRYYGKLTLRRALRKSLNIPSCQIFYSLGKDNDYKYPLDRAALLLGINSQKEIDERFKPEVSTVLGTGSVAPVEMANAFSTFANLGQKKYPNAILYVEDREGKIIYEPWKELEKYYRDNVKKLQIISPENAFVMTSILKDTVHSPEGFLYYRKSLIDNFPPVEIAAKTGTTQNFNDVSIIGFTPEITVAMWCGFKEYGLSLGNGQPAEPVLGNSFLEFMKHYHLNKEPLTFKRPPGVLEIKVCSESGLLPSEDCAEDTLYFEYYIPGSIPKSKCTACKMKEEQKKTTIDKFIDKYEKIDSNSDFFKDNISINKSLLKEYEALYSDVDIEGLLNINLFEDDTVTDVSSDTDIKDDEENFDETANKDSSSDGENIVTTTTIISKILDPKLEIATTTTIKADKPVEVESIENHFENDGLTSDIIEQNDLINDDNGAILDFISDDKKPVINDLSGDNNN
ncbi:MAG: transglycosylase domain-containing protein, partial [Spirochaetes bacterium]|nr:transglycosylase domain-containing protein [Spirochaetota bacterium]